MRWDAPRGTILPVLPVMVQVVSYMHTNQSINQSINQQEIKIIAYFDEALQNRQDLLAITTRENTSTYMRSSEKHNP